MTLGSPGTEVSVVDASTFVAGAPTMIPMVILATAAQKSKPFTNSRTTAATSGTLCTNCATGTFESGVVRTVTSLRQSLELYGTPRFLTDADGNPHHGDARNEYGLHALNRFLGTGNLAYVVRANINLDDSISNVSKLWLAATTNALTVLNTLFTNTLASLNAGLSPLDSGYATTLSATSAKALVAQAFADTAFTQYNFTDTDFQQEFLRDHSVATQGYQDAIFDSSRGWIAGTDVTGLSSTKTYQFRLAVNGVGANGDTILNSSSILSIDGSTAATFDDLVNALNTELANHTFAPATSSPPTSNAPSAAVTVSLIDGMLRFTSALAGVSSSIELSVDSVTNPLFATANMPLFKSFGTAVDGKGSTALKVYTDFTYSTLNGTTPSYNGVNAAITTAATAGGFTGFTYQTLSTLVQTAANTFQYTMEFNTLTSLGVDDADRRAKIAAALIAEVVSNEAIISRVYEHNVIVCPGYPEVTTYLQQLVAGAGLKEEVFVLGSVPMNIAPDGPGGLTEWFASNAVKSNDVAYYYPHPLTANTDGQLILGDSTSYALSTYAYNDAVAQPWYPPAGLRRGLVDGVTSFGYASGDVGGPTTFVQQEINEGQQVALYSQNINYVANINGAYAIFAQQTTQPFTSDLSSVNVSRLVKYIKRGLRKLGYSFNFELNNSFTRNQLRAAVDNYLSRILADNGIYDYVVMCSSENNPPEVIQSKTMNVDVAISPEIAAEFIPFTLVVAATGADLNNTLSQVVQGGANG